MKKKLSLKTSLLVSASAVAGLAMGASIALAAHPPITLFTYEELATQHIGPANAMNTFAGPSSQMKVQVDGNPQLVNGMPTNPKYMKGYPYSPKQTCTGGGATNCHSDGNTVGLKPYSKLADHAFHSQMGENEWMDNSDSGKFMTAATGGMQTGLNPQKPWLQSHGHNGKW